MLNISPTSVSAHIPKDKFSTLQKVEAKTSKKVFKRLIYGTGIIILIILFLPWTQNIRSTGNVTTLRPDQRPQTIHSVIAGRVEKWYVQEGDFVKAGDTIVKISEIKDDYFDSELLPRTQNQLDLKEMSVDAYAQKIQAQENQLNILKTQRELKMEQAKIKLQQTKLKVMNDSLAYISALADFQTAQKQYERMDSLYAKGLKSLTDLETRNLKVQQTKAYELEAKNKWLNSKNELIALKIDLSNVQMSFESDYTKTMSDKFSTESDKLDAESTVTKLKNQYANYEVRTGMYVITAPQDGYVTKTFITGIGETLKEGQQILSLMPKNYDLAIEIYIEPLDLPLVKLGENVRIQFDGWPAIIFSGWPNASQGTYGGVIYAVDQYISENGKYRVLVKPDPKDHPWPKALRFGSGTNSMIMLDDVPIWYELWRKINGFPPNYYTNSSSTKTEKSK